MYVVTHALKTMLLTFGEYIPYLTSDTNAYINEFLTLAALFPIVALLCEMIKIIHCFEVEMWFLYHF